MVSADVLGTTGHAEVIPGIVGLVYHDLSEVRARLEMGHYKALEGTKFGWSNIDNDTVDVTCPHGEPWMVRDVAWYPSGDRMHRVLWGIKSDLEAYAIGL